MIEPFLNRLFFTSDDSELTLRCWVKWFLNAIGVIMGLALVLGLVAIVSIGIVFLSWVGTFLINLVWRQDVRGS